jgi:predicted DsbA family dithiol-disulfide isomerase
MQKYGSTPEQQVQIRQTIAQRGADVGFAFNPNGRGRIYNTFDAHRLLHWAALEVRQQALKKRRGGLLQGKGAGRTSARDLAGRVCCRGA